MKMKEMKKWRKQWRKYQWNNNQWNRESEEMKRNDENMKWRNIDKWNDMKIMKMIMK